MLTFAGSDCHGNTKHHAPSTKLKSRPSSLHVQVSNSSPSPEQRPHRQVHIHESTSHLSCAVATGHQLYRPSHRIASQFPAPAHPLGEPRRQPRPLHPYRIILTLHQPDHPQTLSPSSIPNSLSINNTTTK
jgi:hypothetical protein